VEVAFAAEVSPMLARIPAELPTTNATSNPLIPERRIMDFLGRAWEATALSLGCESWFVPSKIKLREHG
jgi:hypothetical protein